MLNFVLMYNDCDGFTFAEKPLTANREIKNHCKHMPIYSIITFVYSSICYMWQLC